MLPQKPSMSLRLEATQVPRIITCKGAAFTLFWGFADMCLSGLPPVIAGKVVRITIPVAVSVDLFAFEMT